MARMRELFFYVSGEHETLPYAEIRAILEADGFTYRNMAVFPRLLYAEIDVKCLSSIENRSCLTKICGIVLLRCGAYREEILRAAEGVDYSGFVREDQTFSVKVMTTTRPKIDSGRLESAIGGVISRRVRGAKVNLRKPQVSFFGIISRDVFVLGQKIFEPSTKFFRRKSNRRPFNHPSSLSPKLARLTVNLARMKDGSLVLDPFCGTGSILVEASFVGCRILGSDVNAEMLRGTARNLSYFDISWEGLVASEAGHLPFINVDSIATDPPYGRASSTYGVPTKEIVSGFLAEALDLLPVGGYVSIVLPNTLGIGAISESLGYVNVENHLVREHKSLTREISVIQKL